jgi:uncharacterized protein YihD (DUF1040 family)
VIIVRDPNRIDVVLEKIKEVWEMWSDLRLMQLLLNVTYGHGETAFNIEDDRLIEMIEEAKQKFK